MTMVPMGGNKVSANPELMDKHPEVYATMGATAEKVAAMFKVTREEQDVFAANSQKKATEAREKGRFKDEIAPITVTVYDEAGKPQADAAVRRHHHPRRDHPGRRCRSSSPPST